MSARKVSLSIILLPLIAVLIIIGISSVYVVDERKKALVLRIGRVIDVKEEPGLGFKMPFIDNVEKYDARILGMPTEPLEVNPLDDRRLVVDAFTRWRIADLVQFRQAVGSGGIDSAQARLGPIVRDSIRGVLGTVPSTTVLSDDRTNLMNQIRNEARREADSLGIDIIDVRLTRTDLPKKTREATYDRMREERNREAVDEIARGEEAAQRIRAAADRTVRELVSEAEKLGEITRGEADAVRNAIYADAYGRDPEFFAFYRSMTAYEQALRGENSRFVIAPDGEFFSYFSNDGSESANPASTPVPPGNRAEEAEQRSSARKNMELIKPQVTDREGRPLGESAGVELAPVPKSLIMPEQEESEVVPPVTDDAENASQEAETPEPAETAPDSSN